MFFFCFFINLTTKLQINHKVFRMSMLNKIQFDLKYNSFICHMYVSTIIIL